jgi:hypothetical protein
MKRNWLIHTVYLPHPLFAFLPAFRSSLHIQAMAPSPFKLPMQISNRPASSKQITSLYNLILLRVLRLLLIRWK